MQNAPKTDGPRICVVGTSGSGKSTLAKAIANRLNIPYVNSDALYWLPGWTKRPRHEYSAMLHAAADEDAWVLDGNLGTADGSRYAASRATMIVWLDYPHHVIMRQVILRTIKRVAKKEKLFSGNVETFGQTFLSRDSIICWAFTSYPDVSKRYVELFERLGGTGVLLVRLRTPNETRRWLDTLGQAVNA